MKGGVIDLVLIWTGTARSWKISPFSKVNLWSDRIYSVQMYPEMILRLIWYNIIEPEDVEELFAGTARSLAARHG